jgi:hypothetical protein
MKNTKIVALILGACMLGLLVAACGGESSETAKKNFCTSLSDLSSTVMSYEGLDPATATNDELDSAADDIADAWNEVVDEGYDWAYADDNALTEAYDDLYDAIQDVPGDYTVSQSLDALEPQLSAFPQAYSDTFDGSGCSTTKPPRGRGAPQTRALRGPCGSGH